MHEFWTGFCIIMIYFVICATSALILKHFVRVPSEVFRKLLHLILLGSLLVWIFAFSTWWIAALSALFFAVAVYPILALAEKWQGYSQLLTERKSGEIKNSLLIVFTMFAVVITICLGLLSDKLLTLACVYAWGFGDAAAALIGKTFGKHHLEGKYIDGKKSLEGSTAMFVVSFFCVLLILLIRGGLNWSGYLIVSLITAFVSALAELFSKNGMDTIICPLAAMAVLLPLLYLFGGIS